MTGHHPVISFDLAQSHQDALLRQAETKRLGNLAAAPTGYRFDRWRAKIGLTLVRLGERLASRPLPENRERTLSIAELRLSR